MNHQIKNDIKKILYSEQDIYDMCERIGKQIEKDYENSTPIIIGLLTGAVPFVSELIKHISTSVQVEFMCVKSYGSDTVSSGNIRILSDVNCPLEGRDIIILDDIIDTGKTMNIIKNMMLARNANSVKVGCLLEKKARHTDVDFKIDYVGGQVGNEFVVGFGLDYIEEYRNLPFIGILKEEIYKK